MPGRRCGPPASSSTSASCAPGTRCRRSDEVDGIVVLGGEQTALDPALREQAALLREATARGVPVLGVCLGAQLLAHAHGGEVRKLATRHLDWLELKPLPAADGDPVLGLAAARRRAACTGTRTASRSRPGRSSCCARPPAPARASGSARAPGACSSTRSSTTPRSTTGTSTGTARSRAAGVTEEDARAADREHLPGQRALSEAIFGGFAASSRARRRRGLPR